MYLFLRDLTIAGIIFFRKAHPLVVLLFDENFSCRWTTPTHHWGRRGWKVIAFLLLWHSNNWNSLWRKRKEMEKKMVSKWHLIWLANIWIFYSLFLNSQVLIHYENYKSTQIYFCFHSINISISITEKNEFIFVFNIRSRK